MCDKRDGVKNECKNIIVQKVIARAVLGYCTHLVILFTLRHFSHNKL